MIKRTSVDKIMELIKSKETNKVITLDGMRMATLIKNNTCLMIFNTKFIHYELEDTDMFINFINGTKKISNQLPKSLNKYIMPS
jgi:hypothetical protein